MSKTVVHNIVTFFVIHNVFHNAKGLFTRNKIQPVTEIQPITEIQPVIV